MKNYFDYLKFYGNTSFQDLHFNEVDSLILSMLSYVKLDSIVPKEKRESISLKDACTKFLNNYQEKDFKKNDWLFPVSYKLMKDLKNSKRFANARLYYLSSSTDSFGQFGAVTIRLPIGITFISYEGTDSAVVGWKEDFELMYKHPVSSQKKAVEYLNDTLNLFDRNIYIGGHSKGGNLAMYAYMYGKDYYKKRVKHIYNFDGPGFLDDVIDSSLYKEMTHKLTTIIPKESVIGLILGHTDYQVVSSSQKAVMQHESWSWECFGGYLVRSTLSKKSEKLDQNLNEYLRGMSFEERKRFVETIFAVFEKTNITNIMQLKEFKISTLLKIMKEFKNIPNTTKRNLVAILRMLITGMN